MIEDLRAAFEEHRKPVLHLVTAALVWSFGFMSGVFFLAAVMFLVRQ